MSRGAGISSQNTQGRMMALNRKGVISFLAAFFTIAAFAYLFLNLRQDILETRAEFMRSLSEIRTGFEQAKNQIQEARLYGRIEAIWFEKGSRYIEPSTLRALTWITYCYHLRYGTGGEIPIGLDYWRIFAWVEIESGFNPKAKSKAGAYGLTQIMPVTAIGALEQHFGVSGLDKKKVRAYIDDPIVNFKIGLEILIQYQLGFMAAGVASPSDFKLAFSLYAWSAEAVKQLIQARDKNIPKASLQYALDIERRAAKYRG